MTSNNQYVVEILRDAGRISADEAAQALSEASRREVYVLDIMAEHGHDKFELFTTLAAQCGLESIVLTPEDPPLAAAQLIPPEIATRYRVAPIRKTGSRIVLAFGDPLDIETLDTLRYLFKDPVEVLAALPEQINQTLSRLYPKEMESVMVEAGGAEPQIIATEHTEPNAEDASESDEPIIKLVNLLILEGYRERASDIHLEPMAKEFRVRYRIDGALREIEGPPRRLHPSVINRIKIMAKMNIAEKRLPQDGRIDIRIMEHNLDLRVSSIPTNHGESIVMRILDKQNLMLGLSNLGFYADDQALFERLIRYPDGIVLITGPTGSGKTTTLYACLNHLNRPDRKIITAEDPVEYQISGINQVHVRSSIGLTFAAALRSMLRQAPNIIMIGEIRDRETAEIAVNAAMTGHLVLSTLHTNDAPSAITRLADIGVKPFLISSAVRGIIAQRLVRTICEDCRTSYPPNDTERRLLESTIPKLFRGEGCASCGKTGYVGRKGLFEILAVNDEIRQLIYTDAGSSELRACARKLGMRTLREDGLRKAIDGTTTLAEVLRITMRDDN